MSTFTACKAALRQDGITLTKKDGEYRVNFVGGKEATAYYTDSLNDAFNTGLSMAHPVKPLAEAAQFHQAHVVKPSNKMEFDGKASVKVNGRTFTAKANRYGNWYLYVSGRYLDMLFGDYVDQMFAAAEWINTLTQASALAH